VGQVTNFRELRRKVAVDEDEPAARARHAKVFDLLGSYGNAALHRALKRSLRERGEIGESPVFIVRRGESIGVEALPCVFAQLAEPHGVALLPLSDQLAIRREICTELAGRRGALV